jgi:hypothetical protein
MNTAFLTRVRSLYCVEGVPVSTQRHNMREWIKSIRFLGDKWLLAKPISRVK